MEEQSLPNPFKDSERTYIGETSQWFDEKESQHKHAVLFHLLHLVAYSTFML